MNDEQQKAVEEFEQLLASCDTITTRVLRLPFGRIVSALEQAQRERDELRAAWLVEHKETCLHHTDAERKAAGCPVCKSRHATSKINEGLEGAALLGLQTVESLIKERDEAINAFETAQIAHGQAVSQRDELQAKLDASEKQKEFYLEETHRWKAALLAEQAAGASLREAIQELWDEDECGWIIGDGKRECVKCGALEQAPHESGCSQRLLEKALSSTHGTTFLEERERHVKALEFYADKNSWHEVIAGSDIGNEIKDGEFFMAFDKGESEPWTIAREALKETKPL